jgi:hypothetical protein
MLLLMHSLTGCTVPDEAIEPEEEGTILCRSRICGRRRKKRTRPSTAYTPARGTLMQYGNYSLLRLLAIANARSPKGVTTVVLLEELGSRANRINDIIAAEQLKLIERIEGEPPGPGQFPPVFNTITDKGQRLLQKLLLL